MNQSASIDFTAAMQMVIASGVMVSRCSIYDFPRDLNTSGQVDLTTMTPVSGLQNIRCIASPLADFKPNPHLTDRQTTFISEQTQIHVLLDGYYPAILKKHIANVDGTYYVILNVEHDSQYCQTRMAIEEYHL